MTAQLAFFIAGIVAFVAAVVFAVLAILYFRRENIRAVRDDLSGKARLEDIESSRQKRTERAESRRGSLGAAGLGSVTDKEREQNARKQQKKERKVEKQRLSRKGRKKGTKEAVADSSEEKRPASKSVADYQAEYTHGEDGLTWGVVMDSNESASSNLVQEAPAETPVATGAASKAKNDGAQDWRQAQKAVDVSFRVVRREVVVNSDKDLR